MRSKITRLLVRKVVPDPNRILCIWDTEQTGFGLRVTKKGVRSYFFEYSLPGWRSPRRMTIGQATDLPLDKARAKARDLREKVMVGIDPLEERAEELAQPTVRDLAERFMREHATRKAASTRRNYKMLWDLYLLPAIGRRKVADVTWADLAELHRRMRDTPYQANRTLALASKAFVLATQWGWWPRDVPNPARDHHRYREDRQRGQALMPDQLRALGLALQAEAKGSIAAACVRAVMLTGARPKEILGTRWHDLEMDGRLIRLKVAKTGPRAVYLGKAAAEIFEAQPRLGPYVFAGRNTDQPMYDLKAIWYRIKRRAELPERIRLYDATRHTFISTALEIGIALDRVKILAGHAVSSDITARYTHYRPDRLLADADVVAEALAAALDGGGTSRGKVLTFETA